MSSRLALFADCLLVGLFVVVAAVPLVTAYVALVAACAVLRSGHSVGPLVYWTTLRHVIHSGVSGLLVPPLAVFVLALDGLAIAAGVPGRIPLAVLFSAALALLVVGGLRAAARWRPDQRWPDIVRSAAVDVTGDPGGSLLLLLAAGCAAGIAVAVPITVLLLPGLLAFAAVAIDSRRPC